MNYICQSCGEEIEDGNYAMPFNNEDNVCHIDCVDDWLHMNLTDVKNAITIFYEESED